ncbi:hypothetical protein JB92DRAFT_1014720 [Gautieria morchelliformis]|nr:hypothetical protein JB92DRAFT_1014720 [Gautieria morchelliformis]
MVKLAGFADKNHAEAPCTKCHVNQAHLFSDEALRGGMWCDNLEPNNTYFRMSFAGWGATSAKGCGVERTQRRRTRSLLQGQGCAMVRVRTPAIFRSSSNDTH